MMTTDKQSPRQSNRRAARRWGVAGFAKVECRIGSYGFGPNILKSVVNLSETGICVVLKEALKKGQEVEILFAGIDAGKALKRLGTVVWCRPDTEGAFYVGIQFQSPMPYSAMQRIVKPG
jgi:hypothetical protein